MAENHKIESLLQQVQLKVTHSKKLSELNGENFNIFSLLQIEANENNTHSRFLAELLNPKGSHGLKALLLKSFLGVVSALCNDDNLIIKHFNTNSAKVLVEKSIGKIDNENKTGGRVDIVITDGRYSICIENKIYAGDQRFQIERYCNYNKSESLILYLTLFGNEPSNESKGMLENGKDFYCISYQDDITKWLERCYKEAADKPILRETIKQYSILIKKLTGQLTTNVMTEEVRDLILKNLETAKVIADNFYNAKNDLLDKIRTTLKQKLEASDYISKDYIIKTEGSKAGDKNSKLWFHHKNVANTTGIFFGIEPFSGWGNKRNNLFIGILDLHSAHTELFQKFDFEISGWWRGVEYLQFENSDITLSSINRLQFFNDDMNLNNLVDAIVQQTIEYIKKHQEVYIKICREAEHQI